MNRKKFTICIPYEGNFKTPAEYEVMKFEYFCNERYANDLLHAHGVIPLNEVVRIFTPVRHKIFSYRWGWDFSKNDFIGVRLIKNPVNPHVWYLKFTAYDIVG